MAMKSIAPIFCDDQKNFDKMIHGGNKMKTLKDCIEFHGHSCGGLIIGYKVCELASKLLDIGFSKDEEVVVVSENDACSVDALQVVFSTTIGKGNLLFHLRGKQAYSFYNRKTGKSARLVLKNFDFDMTKEEKLKFFEETKCEDMFYVKEALPLPEKAKLFNSFECSKCNEWTAENMLRLENGKMVCIDCASQYKRFDI